MTSEAEDLAKRLENRTVDISNALSMHLGTVPDADCISAANLIRQQAAQIARLTEALAAKKIEHRKDQGDHLDYLADTARQQRTYLAEIERKDAALKKLDAHARGHADIMRDKRRTNWTGAESTASAFDHMGLIARQALSPTIGADRG